MRNQFSVLHWSETRVNRVMYQADDSGDIYVWLKQNAVLDAPGYLVRDNFTLTTWEEGVFIREFEEQMEKAKAVTGEHKCHSEERIREIIREELSKFLTTVHDHAGVPEYYGNVDVVDTFTSIVDYLAEVKTNEELNKHEDRSHEGDHT